MFKNSLKALSLKLSLVSYVFGSMIVALWTVFRFYERPIIFDTVGQQVLAHQWLQGYMGGSIIGQTNYLLKIALLYIPFDVLHIPPIPGLVTYTIIVNIVTFCLIVFLLKKIWSLFNKEQPQFLYIVVLWFASICGSVFWIQFTNSRNLEVAGGLAVAYLLLSYYKRQSIKKLVIVTALSTVVFFADVLQLYMVAIPTLIYIMGNELFSKKTDWRLIGRIVASVAAAALMAKVLLTIVMSALSLQLAMPAQVEKFSLESLAQVVKQFLRLYMGGYELGRVFIVFNIAVVLIALISAAVLYLRNDKKVSWHIVVVSFMVIAANIAIYIISRQADVEGSFRYLIMTAPFVVLLLLFMLENIRVDVSRVTQFMLLSVVLLSTFMVGIKTIEAAVNNKNPNTQQYEAATYGKNYVFAFAGMDTALTGYFATRGEAVLLPLECINGRLQKTNLFFDQAFYDAHIRKSQAITPLILDGQEITNKPYSCSIEAIEKQFGIASELTQLSNGSTVLLYPTDQILSAL